MYSITGSWLDKLSDNENTGGNMWSAIGSIGAGIISGLAALYSSNESSSSVESTNNTNIQLQRENQDWEEYMSNTAYQRASADMAAAGYNPILTALNSSSSAASTPTTQPAKVAPQDQQLTNAIGGAINSAIAMYNSSLQQDQVQSNVGYQGAMGFSAVLSALSNADRNKQLNANSKQEIEESMARISKMATEEFELNSRAAMNYSTATYNTDRLKTNEIEREVLNQKQYMYNTQASLNAEKSQTEDWYNSLYMHTDRVGETMNSAKKLFDWVTTSKSNSAKAKIDAIRQMYKKRRFGAFKPVDLY